MATVAAPERIEALEAPVRRTPKRSWKNLILPTYTKLVIAYLLVPIAVMILYSFNANTAANASAPKVSFRWQGFTFDWWRQWNGSWRAGARRPRWRANSSGSVSTRAGRGGWSLLSSGAAVP